MQQAASNVDVLGNAENVKIMSNILKTNVSACTSIGSFFLPQLGRIWLDMLGLYKAVSGIISEQVASQGPSSNQSHQGIPDGSDRPYCNQDSQSSIIAHDQEGDSETRGDICKESRGSRRRQRQSHSGSAGCDLGGLQPQRPGSTRCGGAECDGDHRVKAWSKSQDFPPPPA